MATLALRSVNKAFGKTQVVRDFNIEIEDGEFIVIVGPSGCGKSTLLRMVAGLESVTDGEIRIGDRIVNDLEPMDRNIAMVFQNYALYPHMTVFDNMAYGLKIAKVPQEQISERVAKAASLLQLDEYLKRKPSQLSGGQRQRVAMGRAIVREPDVFLFDEPLSNLDAKLRVQMRLEIKALQRDLGITSLYVTHDQVEAMTLADRIVVINEGVADQIGRPMDVYRHPATTFVGGFIGSPPMNFVPAHELTSAGTMALQRKYPSREISTVGIRPEQLSVVDPAAAFFTAALAFVEPLGAETLAHLRLSDGTAVTARLDTNATIASQIEKSDSLWGLAWNDADPIGFNSDGSAVSE